MSKSVKCVRDIRDLPPSAYALPTDGRKNKKLCADRRALANLLATFANGDGASITVGVKRIMDALEWSRATTFRRLEELRQLGILESDGKLTFQGTRLRRLDASAVRKADARVSDSAAIVSDSRGPMVSDTTATVSDSCPIVSRIGETQPSIRPTIQTEIQTDQPTVLQNANGGRVDGAPKDVDFDGHGKSEPEACKDGASDDAPPEWFGDIARDLFMRVLDVPIEGDGALMEVRANAETAEGQREFWMKFFRFNVDWQVEDFCRFCSEKYGETAENIAVLRRVLTGQLNGWLDELNANLTDDKFRNDEMPLQKHLSAWFKLRVTDKHGLKRLALRDGLDEQQVVQKIHNLVRTHGPGPVVAAWQWFLWNRDFDGLTKTTAARLFVRPSEFEVALESARCVEYGKNIISNSVFSDYPVIATTDEGRVATGAPAAREHAA